MATSETLHRGVYLYRTEAGWYHLRFYDPNKHPKQKSVALDTNVPSLAHERARQKFARYLASPIVCYEG